VNTTERFLVAMGVIVTLPYLVWRLGRTEYWAPLVVVQIVAGIVLGPGLVGAWFPQFHAAVFTPAVTQALAGVAWWGVILFVFLAGLELDLRQAWHERRDTTLTAALAMLLPLALGGAAGAALWALGGWAGPQAGPVQFTLAMGMACAVTALPILALLMEKMGVLHQALGQRILRYASLDDIVIWAVLAAVLADWARMGRQALFLAAFALLVPLVRRLLPRLPASDRWFVALGWLILCALGADWSGLHYIIGAFLAGAVLDADWFERPALDATRRNVLLLLMPVFFLSTGLRTEWDAAAGGWAVPLAAALLLAAAVAGKLAGVALAARALRWPPGQAALVGWLLQTKGLIEIIFASVLLDRGVISAPTFTALLLMAVASTMLTVPMVAPRLRALVAGAAAEAGTATRG
jgi:Kef-type K+ transport system membrane component KefB